MVLMACVLDAAPSERRIWGVIGFGFALMYSVMNSIVRNEGESVAVLRFEPGAFLFAVKRFGVWVHEYVGTVCGPSFCSECRRRSPGTPGYASVWYDRPVHCGCGGVATSGVHRRAVVSDLSRDVNSPCNLVPKRQGKV